MIDHRVLIFNLPRQAGDAVVRALVDRAVPAAARPPGPGPGIEMHTIPGTDGERFAVVHMGGGWREAGEIARHLNGCRHVGGQVLARPLWSWLPVMAWA